MEIDISEIPEEAETITEEELQELKDFLKETYRTENITINT